MADTLVTNRSRAPTAWSPAPDSRVRPTTDKGGTSEMAMATPGRVSEMSSRARAMAPTAPVASAATRSTRCGVTRDATCELVLATTGISTRTPSR